MRTVQRWTGLEAQALRIALRFTVRAFAEHLGVADRTVSKWDAAGTATVPRPDTQAMLDTVLTRADETAQRRFGILCQELISTCDPSDDHDTVVGLGLSETDEVKRRQLLRLLSLSSSVLALPSAEIEINRMIAVAGGKTRMDVSTLVDFRRLHLHLWQVYGLARVKASVLPLIHEQLGTLTEAAAHTDRRFREQLCALLSDMYQLAGEVHVDGGRITDAAQCYSVAAAAAQEAGAHDLWATALTRQAYIAIDDEHSDEAVQLLDHAARLASLGNSSLPTAPWVAAVRAQAHAGLGDDQRWQRDLDAADGVADLPPVPAALGWLRFDGGRLPEQRGRCLVAVGRYDQAETVLVEALSRSSTTRRRAGILVDLAMIGIERRDPEAVAPLLREALASAHATGSGVIATKLRTVLVRSRPLGTHSQVRELNQEIARLTGGEHGGRIV